MGGQTQCVDVPCRACPVWAWTGTNENLQVSLTSLMHFAAHTWIPRPHRTVRLYLARRCHTAVAGRGCGAGCVVCDARGCESTESFSEIVWQMLRCTLATTSTTGGRSLTSSKCGKSPRGPEGQEGHCMIPVIIRAIERVSRRIASLSDLAL